MRINQVIEDVLAKEGGYVDHPNDRGGPTNFGITQAVARANGFTGPMRALTRDQARDIYRRMYVEKPRFDDVGAIDEAIGAELVDTGVNMGPVAAAKLLQRALNFLNRRGRDFPDLVMDGSVGPGTLSALETFKRVRGAEGMKRLLALLNALQGARYVEIAERNPTQEDFAFGWLARIVE